MNGVCMLLKGVINYFLLVHFLRFRICEISLIFIIIIFNYYYTVLQNRMEYRTFSLFHQSSHPQLTPDNPTHYETSDSPFISSCKSELSHFNIHPTDNTIIAFDELSRKIVVFPFAEDELYSFPLFSLSVIEDMIIVDNNILVLSRFNLLPRYRLSIYTIEGYLITYVTWNHMTHEGFFNRLERYGIVPIGSRMAVTERAERLVVESNLSNRYVANSTLRFYNDEMVGFKYAVRSLGMLRFTLQIRIIDKVVHEYCLGRDGVTNYTCKLDHFLPEEDLPVVERVSLISTDVTGSRIPVFFISTQDRLFQPELHVIDTSSCLLSMNVIDLINGCRATCTAYKVNLKDPPFYNALTPDLTKIIPAGIVFLSNGLIKTFWTIKSVIFIQKF